MCCFLSGTFDIFTAGVLDWFDEAAVFAVLNGAPLTNLLFRRFPEINSFTIDDFTFVFEGEEDDLDIC
jgi:hypothetical protein